MHCIRFRCGNPRNIFIFPKAFPVKTLFYLIKKSLNGMVFHVNDGMYHALPTHIVTCCHLHTKV